jgi:DNA-directed RNA polymerase II subunit RPB2
MAICNHSGTIAIYNKEQNNFYSPIIDGPLAFEKIDSETLTPSLVTKYGKEFSIVEVPYCLKLLIHELTAMNIQMRLITSDNIENLTSYGKHSLGKLNKFIERSENFIETTVPEPKPEPPKRVTIKEDTELDANEQRALVHDIERLKQNNSYSPVEEEKSKQSILALRAELKEGNISQLEYNKLLIPETKAEPESVSQSENSQSENESVSQSENSQSENEESVSQSENESGSEAPTESADESELKEYTPVVTETKKIIKLN